MARKTEKVESPEQYYWRVFEAKKNGDAWAKNIPLDKTPYMSLHHRCCVCGNPDMSQSFSGAECKKCGIKRLVDIYGYSDEDAAKIYEEREKRKESTMKYYELARHKKVSNTRRSEEDIEHLPF